MTWQIVRKMKTAIDIFALSSYNIHDSRQIICLDLVDIVFSESRLLFYYAISCNRGSPWNKNSALLSLKTRQSTPCQMLVSDIVPCCMVLSMKVTRFVFFLNTYKNSVNFFVFKYVMLSNLFKFICHLKTQAKES